jgi:hypothetical protein
LQLQKRGIRYHRLSDYHDGLPTPGLIKRGPLLLTHGWSTAKHAASAHLMKSGACIAYGHTHRSDYASQRTTASGLIAAWSPGCLCQLHRLWNHSLPTDWSHGYLLQLTNSETGHFQMIHVAIEQGESFLGPMIEQIAAA